MPQRGWVFTPLVAFDFSHAVVLNPSRYSVMSRPMIFVEAHLFSSRTFGNKKGKLGHLVGRIRGHFWRFEVDERETLS